MAIMVIRIMAATTVIRTITTTMAATTVIRIITIIMTVIIDIRIIISTIISVSGFEAITIIMVTGYLVTKSADISYCLPHESQA